MKQRFRIFDEYRGRVLSEDAVLFHISRAVKKKKPFALVRIGRGETQLIGYVIGLRNKHRREGYFTYAGVSRPQYKSATKELVRAVKKADLVGVGTKMAHHEFPMIQRILRHYRMKLPKLVAKSTVNRKILKPPLFELLKGSRVILIGRRAAEADSKMKEKGIRVAATYNVDNFKDIRPVMRQIRKGPEFDIALLSAGINAVILAVKIKEQLGKVAIDFGHSLDKIIDGNKSDYVQLEEKYIKSKR